MELSIVLHPLNAAEQRVKFLAGECSEPEFIYRKGSGRIGTFPEFAVDDEVASLYRDRIAHTKGLALLISLAGEDEEFSALSQVLFPVIPLKGAYDLRSEHVAEEAVVFGAAEVQRACATALAECGIVGWEVGIVDHAGSRMFVNQWARRVAVRADIRVGHVELQGLLRHEIGVHVLRAAHGLAQQEPLLHVGTLKGRMIEEGVACFVENPLGDTRIFLRHLAVSSALSHSFRETWQVLREHGCSAEDAWMHALRAKRGLAHGASHGACTKDALYAQGFEEIRAYAGAGGAMAPLLSAPVHPDEIGFFRAGMAMSVFPLPALLA